MTKPTISILDVETGETIIREMTDAEFAQYQKDQADAQAETAAQTAAATAKAALLAKLGITEDEARLLLGGN